MPKGYILSAHRSPADPIKREAYTKIAVPAFEAYGGKFLAKASKVNAKENVAFTTVAIVNSARIVIFSTPCLFVKPFSKKEYVQNH